MTVGLTKLFSTLPAILPHSIIICGERGSGKKLVAAEIAKRLKASCTDITEDVSEERINNIYRNPSLMLYLIDLNKIVEKDQNVLLKIFEEPPANAYFVLITNSIFNVLPTIMNRGFLINIPHYVKEDLVKYATEREIEIGDKYFKTIVKTPGDIERIYTLNVNLNEIEALVDKIAGKLVKASFTNTLTIIDKLNFKDEYDKIDVDFFLLALYNKLVENYINDKVELDNLLAKEVNKCVIDFKKFPTLNKRIRVTELLIKMWKEAKEWN